MACDCRAVMSQSLVYWAVRMLELVAAFPPVVEASSPAVWHFSPRESRQKLPGFWSTRARPGPGSLLPHSAGKPSHRGQYTFKGRETDSPPGGRADSQRDKGIIATIFQYIFLTTVSASISHSSSSYLSRMSHILGFMKCNHVKTTSVFAFLQASNLHEETDMNQITT